MGLDFRPNGQWHVVNDRVIVELFADDDRFALFASRRRGERGDDRLPHAPPERPARFGFVRIGSRFSLRPVVPAGDSVGDMLDAFLNGRSAAGQFGRRNAREFGEPFPHRVAPLEDALLFRFDPRAVAALEPRQFREGLLLQPVRIGRILEPAVMDADVVTLDVLGEDAAVAAINPAVEAGDRFQTFRRRLERGNVIVDEPAVELGQSGRHEYERQGDADEQP